MNGFCLKQGQGLKALVAHPHPNFPIVPPPGSYHPTAFITSSCGSSLAAFLFGNVTEQAHYYVAYIGKVLKEMEKTPTRASFESELSFHVTLTVQVGFLFRKID